MRREVFCLQPEAARRKPDLLLMPFDTNFPPDHQPLNGAPFRAQFNALNDLITALQSQLAPLVPVLNRDAGGHWTLAYTGPTQAYWLVWTRSSDCATWASTGDLPTTDFPSTDDALAPAGTSWWQVKICGEGDNNNQSTPFSNVISFGPVPA